MERPDFSKIDISKPSKFFDSSVEGTEQWETSEKIDIKQIYTEKDIEGLRHHQFTSGLPPFIGGPYGGMYAIRPWTIRQYAGR